MGKKLSKLLVVLLIICLAFAAATVGMSIYNAVRDRDDEVTQGPVGPAGQAGERGTYWFTGEGDPRDDGVLSAEDAARVQKGDYFLDTDSGNIYSHNGTAWEPEGVSLKGASWQYGPKAPTDATKGQPGDFYLEVEAGQVWQYNGETGKWERKFSMLGTDGDDGSDGTVWYNGADDKPATHVTNPKDGDYYIDNSTGDVYQYDGTEGWTKTDLNIKGTPGNPGNDGATWYRGEVAPTDGQPTGVKKGDYYLNTKTGDVYQYNGTTWGEVVINIEGAQWHKGTEAPTSDKPADAQVGDYYLNTATGDVYEKVAANCDQEHTSDGIDKAKDHWHNVGNIKGADGARWFNGTKNPNEEEPAGATVGDYYLNTADGHVYEKVASCEETGHNNGENTKPHWHDVGIVRGDDGSVWHHGTEAPQTGQPDGVKKGDYYLDTTTGNIYQYDGEGWGTVLLNIRGAKWYNGTGTPQSNEGPGGLLEKAQVGDYYFDQGTNNVYQKDASGWQGAGNIKGDRGALWFNGNDNPNDVEDGSLDDAQVGDYYIDNKTGNVYTKAADNWNPVEGLNVRGDKWHSGTGAPETGAPADAQVGDYYHDEQTGKVYVKVAANCGAADQETAHGEHWHEVGNIRAAVWYSGSGKPETLEGTTLKNAQVGDYYIDTATGNVYTKEAEGWKPVEGLNMRGVHWYTGADAPNDENEDPTDMQEGDYYRDTTTGAIYTYESGEWKQVGNVRASVWYNGAIDPESDPYANEAQDGDYYIYNVTGDVYKRVGGKWVNQNVSIRGSKWHTGEGAPVKGVNPENAQEGDYYRDTTTQAVYYYDGNDWSQVGNVRASVWYNGKGDPTTHTGPDDILEKAQDGDYYIDNVTGNVYKRDKGAWDIVEGLNINGNRWYKGTGEPNAENAALQGKPLQANDYYLDETTGKVYTYDGVSNWSQVGNVRASVWYSGEGEPKDEILTTILKDAQEGDYYINTTTGDIYKYVKDQSELKWTKQDGLNIRGVKWYSNAGAPNTEKAPGALTGDYYRDTNNQDIYTYNGSSWDKVGSVRATKWYSGNGTPGTQSITDAQEGDFYLDKDNGNVYQYTDGQWSAQPILNTRGAKWYSGNGAPGTQDITDAQVGDFYLDLDTGDVYKYTAGGWDKPILNARGDKWYSNTGAPDTHAGDETLTGSQVGDYYIDTTTGDVYKKTDATNWQKQDINVRGAKWYSGEGAPDANTPKDAQVGDYYHDQATGKVYVKVASCEETGHNDGQNTQPHWHEVGNIRATVWYNGAIDPESDPYADEAQVGDYYIYNVTGDVYTRTEDGWQKVDGLNINGNRWYKGNGAPNAPEGNSAVDGKPLQAGDFYLDENSGAVYAYDGENWTQAGSIRATVWFSGATPPVDGQPTEARAGDYYIDTTTGNVYKYDGSEWGSAILNTRGVKWYSGEGTPTEAANVGGVLHDVAVQKGDYYLNTKTGELYQYGDEGWGSPILNTRGAKWFNGAGAPTDPTIAGTLAEAQINDYYIDTVTGNVYKKTGADAWTLQNINVRGSKWYQGNGAPDANTPKDAQVGDYYHDQATGKVYVKVASCEETGHNDGQNTQPHWHEAGSIRATVWFSGNGAPDAVDGALAGDFYLDLTTGNVYKYDGNDWGDPILNARGNRWYSGEGDPTESSIAATLTGAQDGDYYINTKTGNVYKYDGKTWGNPILNARGVQWYSGKVAPTDPSMTTALADSQVGDFYLDETTGDVYKKNAEGWGNPILNTHGAQWFNGNGAPETVDGALKGDYYLDSTTGKVYKYDGSDWTEEANIRGSKWFHGNWSPDSTLNAETIADAKPGDYYLDMESGDIYVMVASCDASTGHANNTQPHWHNIGNIKGSQWLNSDHNPTSGVVTGYHYGDYWLNTTTGDIFVFEQSGNGGEWKQHGNIKGVRGSIWFEGEGEPTAPAEGKFQDVDIYEGDYYLDTKSGDIYKYGAEGWGDKVGNIKGVRGSKWFNGEDEPTLDPADGVLEGDYYLDTKSGDVYTYESGIWTPAGNIKGVTGRNPWQAAIGARAPELTPDFLERFENGDFYIDITTHQLYQLQTENGVREWKPLFDMQGPRGTKWVVYSGDSSASHPETMTPSLYFENYTEEDLDLLNGDIFLNSLTGDLWVYTGEDNKLGDAKDATKWEEAGSIKGVPGRAARWYVGAGVPTVEDYPDSADGDMYLDNTTGDVYQRVGSTWEEVDNIRGSLWYSAPVGDPTQPLYGDLQQLLKDAKVNDLFYNTTTGKVYQLQYVEGNSGLMHWVELAVVLRGTRIYYGYASAIEENVPKAPDFEKDTPDAQVGDFYFQGFYTFSGWRGYRIFVLELHDGEPVWNLFADLSEAVEPSEITTYFIHNYDELAAVRDAINGGNVFKEETAFVVVNDIEIPADADWTPIGNADHPFMGTFIGGSVLSERNMSYTDKVRTISGVKNGILFGDTTKATIKNIYIKGVFDGTSTEGGLDWEQLVMGTMTNPAIAFASADRNFGTYDTFVVAEYTHGDALLRITWDGGKGSFDWYLGAAANAPAVDTASIALPYAADASTDVSLTFKDKLFILVENVSYQADGEPKTAPINYTFNGIKFLGKTYIDVTNAKNVTITNCYADVDPIEACERDEDGKAITETVPGQFQGATGKNRSVYAAFIVSRNVEGLADGLTLTVTGNTILSAQSTGESNDAAPFGRQGPDEDSMAILIHSKIAKATIEGNTFGGDFITGRYTKSAVQLLNIAESAEISVKNNTVYGEDGFTAFVLGSTASAAYTAKFEANAVEATTDTFLSVKGTGKAQVYLLGNKNTLGGSEKLYDAVKTESDESFNFIAFDAELNAAGDKLTAGKVYIGSNFGAEHKFGPADLEAMVEPGNEGDVWIIDITFEDPLGFVQHVEDYEDHYYINDVNGLESFRDMVNGIGTYEGKTPNSFDGKTIVQTDDISLKDSGNWISIGTQKNPFKGTFDGGIYGDDGTVTGSRKISDITMDLSEETTAYDSFGLFGWANGATLQNITIENVKVINAGTTDLKFGSLVGSITHGTVSNITLNGDVQIGGHFNSSTGNFANGYFYYAGSVIGHLYFSQADTITVAVNEGSIVRSDKNRIGGVVGFAQGEGTSIKTVKSNIDVFGSASGLIGGLVGYAGTEGASGTIEISDITITGNVIAKSLSADKKIGAIVGGTINSGTINITNAHFEGEIWGYSYEPEYYSFVGAQDNASGASGTATVTITDSTMVWNHIEAVDGGYIYYYPTNVTKSTDDSATATATTQYAGYTTYVDWAENGDVTMNVVADSAKGFNAFAKDYNNTANFKFENLTAGFGATADLDFTGIASPAQLTNFTQTFVGGTFDVETHEWSGETREFTITNRNASLFASTDGATIKNLTLNGVTIEGVANVGGLVDTMNGGTIENVTLKNVSINGINTVGGVVGKAENNAKITNVTVENITIDATTDKAITGTEGVGGVVGRLYQSSMSTVTVQGTIKITGNVDVGGVAGRSEYSTLDTVKVLAEEGTDSYVLHGHTAGTTDVIGGIAGFTAEGASNSFSDLTIENIKVSGTVVGGLFGILHSGASVDKATLTNVIVDMHGGWNGYHNKYSGSNGGTALNIGAVAGVGTGSSDIHISNINFVGELLREKNMYGRVYTNYVWNGGYIGCEYNRFTKFEHVVFDGENHLYAKLADGFYMHDGVLEIENENGLVEFSNMFETVGKDYQPSAEDSKLLKAILTDDITMSEGTAWTPITNNQSKTPYAGEFDGNGKTIKGLTGSLFGYTAEGAEIHDLTLDGVKIESATANVGALVGEATDTTINNVTVNGSISGSYNVGGLVGVAHGTTTITDVLVKATVIKTDTDDAEHARSIGLIVGAAEGELTLNSVTVSGSIDNKYATNNLNYLVYNYGLVGSALTGEADDTWALAADENVLPAATVEFDGAITVPQFTGSVNADIVATDLYLTATFSKGTVEHGNVHGVMVTVNSAKGLASIAELVNGGVSFEGETVMLGKDISMMDYEATKNAWTPIGTKDHPFSGTFKGLDNKIAHLYGSLFGYTDGAKIMNLALVDQAMQPLDGKTAESGCAALVAEGTDTTISHVTIEGNVLNLNGNYAVNPGSVAAAPFGITGSTKGFTFNTVDITLTFRGITFTAEIGEASKAVVAYTGDTFAEGETAAEHDYKAVLNDTIFRLGGFNHDVNNGNGPKAEFTFTGIKFTGNSYIQLCATVGGDHWPNVAKVTVTNCYADVTPEQNSNRQPAFILGYERWNAKNSTQLILTDNVIYSATSATAGTYQDAALAIFSWSPFADGTVIKNNTFGSADRPFHNAIIKILDFQSDLEAPAKLTFEGNTFYADAAHITESKAAIDLAPSQVAPYEVWIVNNTLNLASAAEGYTLVSAENAGGSAKHTRVFITADNKVFKNGEEVEITKEFATSTSQVANYDFIGYDVEVSDSGKIAAGHFVYGTTAKYEAQEGATEDNYDALLKSYVESKAFYSSVWVEEESGHYNLEFNYKTRIISTVEELKAFRDAVNSGVDYKGLTVLLWRDGDSFDAETGVLTPGAQGSEFDLNKDLWTPIGLNGTPFVGTFDGRGYTIKNLSSSQNEYAGLFGSVNGTIRNLKLEDVIVTATVGGYAGAVAASLSGSIENVLVTGNVHVSAQTNYAGGVVGYIYGDITNAALDGLTWNADYTVQANDHGAGGIAGFAGESGYTFTNVTANDVHVKGGMAGGGILGYAPGTGKVTIIGAKVSGTIEKTQYWNQHMRGLGGIVGATAGTEIVIEKSHFTGNFQVNGRETFSSLYNYGIAGAQDSASYTLTATESSVTLEVADGFTYRSTWNSASIVDAYFDVSNVKGLEFFRDVVNYKLSSYSYTLTDFANDVPVKLTTDLDLKDIENWDPIGAGEHPFKGHFDGNGLTIQNLNVTAEYAGLFGLVRGNAIIEKLTVSGATLKEDITSGEAYAGAVVAKFWPNTKEAKLSELTVENVTAEAHRYAGGVVGQSYGPIYECTAKNVTITATPNWDGSKSKYDNGDKIGGLVGWFADDSREEFHDNYAEDITITAYRDVGGLAGYVGRALLEGNSVKGVQITVDQLTNSYGGETTNAGYLYGRIRTVYEDWSDFLDGTVIEGADYSLTYNINTSTALQSALDEAAAYGTTTINLEKGTYAGTSEQQINSTVLTGFTILGNARMGAKLDSYTRTIKDLTINGNGNGSKFTTPIVMYDTVESAASPTCLNVDGITVSNLTFENIDNPIYFYSVNRNSLWKNLTFEGIDVSWKDPIRTTTLSHTGIYVYSENGNVNETGNYRVDNITVTGSTFTNTDYAIHVHAAKNLTVTNNDFNTYFHSAIGTQGAAVGGNVTVTDNRVWNSVTPHEGSGFIRGSRFLGGTMTITNNEFYGQAANPDEVDGHDKMQILINMASAFHGGLVTSGNVWFAADSPEDAAQQETAETLTKYAIVERNDANLNVENGASDHTFHWHLELAVSTVEDTGSGLAGFNTYRNDVNSEKKYFTSSLPVKLVEDINLKDVDWTPIGLYEHPFRGTFDGNGHTISNLTLDHTDRDYLGLFGVIGGYSGYTRSAGYVRNLTLQNVSIKGGNYVGGVVANIASGEVSDITVTGNIHLEGKNFVGGVIGYSYTHFNNLTVNKTEATSAKIALDGTSLGKVDFDIISQGESAGGAVGATFGGPNSNLSVKNVNVYAGNAAGGAVGNVGANISFDQVSVENVRVAADNYCRGIILGATQSGDELKNYDWRDCKVWNVSSDGDNPGSWYGESDASVVAPRDYDGNEVTPGEIAPDADRINTEWITEELKVSNENTGFAKIYKGKSDAALAIRYEISSEAGLIAFAKAWNNGLITEALFEGGKIVIRLAKDIDMQDAKGFAPIGTEEHAFKGTFDGRDHTIYNLTVNGEDYVGLFGHVGHYGDPSFTGTIENLTIYGATITGKQYVGVVAGDVRGTVSNVKVEGHIIVEGTGTRGAVGGVVGHAYANFTNVHVNADETSLISATNVVGGIVGAAGEGSYIYQNCTVNVTLQGGTVGGIAGQAQKDNSFVDCKVEATLKAAYAVSDTVGGIVGNATGAISVLGCHFEGTLAPQDRGTVKPSYLKNEGLGTGTFASITDTTVTIIFAEGYKRVATWGIDGKVTVETYISTEEALAYMATIVKEKYFEVDFKGETVYLENGIELTETWTPIGTKARPFKGTFDGKGNTISGLTINDETLQYAGLFGYINNATIKDLNMKDVTITAKSQAGAVVGHVVEQGSRLQDITVTNVTITGESELGGLVGNFYQGQGSNLTVKGNVKIAGYYKLGGLAGGFSYATKGENFTVEATEGSSVIGTYQAEKLEGDSVGGVIGFTESVTATLTNLSASNLTVSGTKSVGGAIGKLHSNKTLIGVTLNNITVTNSETPADYIKAESGALHVGGIVGQIMNNSTITVDGSQLSNVQVITILTYGQPAEDILHVNGGKFVPSQVIGGVRNEHKNVTLNLSGDFSGVTVNSNIQIDSVINGRIREVSVASAEQLMYFNENYGTGKLIGLAGEGLLVTLHIRDDINMEGKRWDPLDGNWLAVDGHGHTISNLTCNTNSSGKAGFFGDKYAGDISNLTINGFTASGSQVGVFAGNSTAQAKLINCHIAGEINITYVNQVWGGSYNESIGGVGAAFGVTSFSTAQGVTIEKGCTVNLTAENVVSEWAPKDYVLGYMPASCEATYTANNGTITVNGLTVCAIGNETELIAFRDKVNDGTDFNGVMVVLTQDIDLGGGTWTPIGTATHPFMGVFDGNNHTISNINVSGSKYVGLFGFVGKSGVAAGVAIKNLIIDGVNTVTVNGTTHNDRNDSGLLVGYAARVAFSNITIAESAQVTVTGVGSYSGNAVGGLIGASQTCTYNAIKANCMIRVNDKCGIMVGGLIGISMHDTLTDIYVKNAWVDGNYAVGGLIGTAFGHETLTNVQVGGNVYMNFAWYYPTTPITDYFAMIGGLIGTAETDTKETAEQVLTISGSSFTGSITRVNVYEVKGEDKVDLHKLPELPNFGLVGSATPGTTRPEVTITSTTLSVDSGSYKILDNGYATWGTDYVLTGEYNEAGEFVEA